jgi:hypothetical protein
MNRDLIQRIWMLLTGIGILFVLIIGFLLFNAYQSYMWNECIKSHAPGYCSAQGYGKGI